VRKSHELQFTPDKHSAKVNARNSNEKDATSYRADSNIARGGRGEAWRDEKDGFSREESGKETQAVEEKESKKSGGGDGW